MLNDEPFGLRNDPPPPRRFTNACSEQLVLLAGMDCVAGQKDLFDTDGVANQPQEIENDAPIS